MHHCGIAQTLYREFQSSAALAGRVQKRLTEIVLSRLKDSVSWTTPNCSSTKRMRRRCRRRWACKRMMVLEWTFVVGTDFVRFSSHQTSHHFCLYPDSSSCPAIDQEDQVRPLVPTINGESHSIQRAQIAVGRQRFNG